MKKYPDDPGPAPRYRWKETWPGEGHEDYQAWDGDRSFGRIMFETNGTMRGKWRWSISHIKDVKRHLPDHNGWESFPRLAAAKVEDHYERLMLHNDIPLNR